MGTYWDDFAEKFFNNNGRTMDDAVKGVRGDALPAVKILEGFFDYLKDKGFGECPE